MTTAVGGVLVGECRLIGLSHQVDSRAVLDRFGPVLAQSVNGHPSRIAVAVTIFLSTDELRDSDAKIVVHHQNFAARDEASVDINVDRVAGEFVQSDDTSAAKL